MSADVIGIIIALFAFTVTVLGGVGGMLARQSRVIDGRFDRFEIRMDQRFEQVDKRFERVEAELGDVKAELVEVKVAVARLEGPLPKLQRL